MKNYEDDVDRLIEACIDLKYEKPKYYSMLKEALFYVDATPAEERAHKIWQEYFTPENIYKTQWGGIIGLQLLIWFILWAFAEPLRGFLSLAMLLPTVVLGLAMSEIVKELRGLVSQVIPYVALMGSREPQEQKLKH